VNENLNGTAMTDDSRQKPMTVLMVDGKADGQSSINDALRQCGVGFHAVENGGELMDYLHRRGKFSDRAGQALPGLILCDLSAPSEDFAEAMKEIRSSLALHQIPVIVLTASKADEKQFKNQGLEVDSFIVKPGTVERLAEAMKTVTDYWFNIVRVPGDDGGDADNTPSQGLKGGGVIRVLLVEDDEDDYVLTKEMLAESTDPHFELDWVDSFDKAVRVLGDDSFDVCLIDYRLGEHTGIELLTEAIDIGCKAPIIMLTGQGDHEIDTTAMMLGAADYLLKGQIVAPLLKRTIRYAVQHKLIENALDASRKRFQTIVNTAPMALVIYDLKDGRILFANGLAAKTLGMTPDDIVERSVECFYCDNSDYDKVTESVKNEGGIYNYEVRLKTMDETPLWVVLSSNPMDFDGQSAVVSGFYDISWGKKH
jgi:PAS domain S-box-containing protein